MLPEPKNTQTKYSETEIASGSEVSYNNNNLVSPSTLDSQPLNYDDYFLENEDLLQEKEINETCFRQSDIKPKKLVSTVKDVEYNSGYNVKIVKGDKTEDSIAVRTHTDLQMQNETKKDKKTEYKKMTKDKETTSKDFPINNKEDFKHLCKKLESDQGIRQQFEKKFVLLEEQLR